MRCDGAGASPGGGALAPEVLPMPVSAPWLSGTVALSLPTPLVMALFVALSVAGALGPARPGHAQTPPADPAVCPAPGEAVPAGHRVRCVRENGAAGDVEIDVRDTTIFTYRDESDAVHGGGVGGSQRDIDIELRDSMVETFGGNASALRSNQRGSGDAAIAVRNSVLTTHGAKSEAIRNILVNEGGAARIRVDGSRVITHGVRAAGVHLHSQGSGVRDAALEMYDSAVVTHGNNAFGVGMERVGSRSGGTVSARIARSTLVTHGYVALGLQVKSKGAGDVEIDLEDVNVETRSTDLDSDGDTYSLGVNGVVGSISESGAGTAGDVSIRTRGGSILTHGILSRGIQGAHLSNDGRNRGDLRIATAGTRVETRGADADGILAYHTGTGQVDIRVDGGRIDALGEGSSGIRIGQVAAPGTRPGRTAGTGAVERAAPVGTDGYRRQTVTVDAPVTGGPGVAAGVFLAGGGRVAVGPRGRLGAGSGIAIFAAGDTTVGGETILRRLHVDLRPDGRPPSDLLDGVIRNDGGATVLAVNGVALYDSADGGRQRSWAPNGARDVALADGFAGLDFSTPEAFVDRLAPRAAVYEALPGVLHRLDERSRFGGEKLRTAGQPLWLRLAGGRGSRGGKGGSVGAEYDYSRFLVEAGIDIGLAGNLTGSPAARLVSGSAEVSAATGGGRIDARGHGLSFGLAWQSEEGWYADGRLSATRYAVDLKSAARGDLRSGAGALVHTVDLEAGRRFGVGRATRLTPRAWLRRSGLSLDGFADAVGARVSLREANRLRAGAGAALETVLDREGGGRLALQASLGVERTLGGRETGIDVSGETLTTREPDTRLLLGLGAAWRHDGLSFRATLGGVQGVGMRDAAWTGRLELGLAF